MLPNQVRPGRYDDVVKAMKSIGWFMPPYGNQGRLDGISRQINKVAPSPFDEVEVERVLGDFYTPDRMGAMVIHMYPQIPVIDLYQKTIAESVFAHFCRLHHVAVTGLMPVVEGAGRELARKRGTKHEGSVKAVFVELITNAKEDAWARKIGNTREIDDMLTGALDFFTKYFFEQSDIYPLADKTNRHGVLHGAYRDSDYGRPTNFYKTLGAVDILTFVSMLQTNRMTGFVPPHTVESRALSERFYSLQTLTSL